MSDFVQGIILIAWAIWCLHSFKDIQAVKAVKIDQVRGSTWTTTSGR